MERRLAAILAADVVGYSRLMGEDETGVLAALKSLRADLFDPLIAAHHGRIVKLMGDGALVEFASVVDAVTCAAEVQRQLAARNADLPPNQRLELRIGVNLGDVMIEGDDIYGDGVNVAARLEGEAEPGAVYVSEAVAAQASGKAPVGFAYLGERRLKNIAEPVKVYKVDLEGRAITRRVSRRRPAIFVALAAVLAVIAVFAAREFDGSPSSPDPAPVEVAMPAMPSGPTLAVLPFRNLSGDPAQDYLAAGISEDVVVELGQYRDLNILSRQSTESYRERDIDMRGVGQALGADYVLEGSVRRVGERLRVTARLVDARTGAQVWSEAIDEELTATGLLDAQLRITERVALAVGDFDGAIKRTDARRARSKPPEKLSSYECALFQPGLLYDRAMQQRVRGCILRVVEEEPGYWRGWAQLADALRVDVMQFGGLYDGSQDEKLARAEAAARRAISLNPDSARAHYVLSHILLLGRDLEGFYAEAEHALAIGGDRDVEARVGYWFTWTGRPEIGAALLRRAIELNPKSTREPWHRGLARYHFIKGEYDAALEQYLKGAQPDLWWSVALEVAILQKLGREKDAIAARDRLYSLRPGIKIADIVWLYRRFQRSDADSAKFVEAFRAVGIPEGTYAPLDLGGSG